MAQFTRTWWGQRFITALEEFTDTARLGRGRSYASGGRILRHELKNGTVTANVRGSINPYFGVYKEPIYTTRVTMPPISAADWQALIADLSSKASFVAKLLLNEVPDNIEDVFARHDLRLLPNRQHDFTTSCSCPDYANPCKHIAGVCYLLASDLDRDPFLLFELRGLSREQLHTELARSPLGQILASELTTPEVPIEQVESFYPTPHVEAAIPVLSLKDFWTGARRLPAANESTSPASVPALLIKKSGDFPDFWPKSTSFIATMEELYERVRSKSAQLK